MVRLGVCWLLAQLKLALNGQSYTKAGVKLKFLAGYPIIIIPQEIVFEICTQKDRMKKPQFRRVENNNFSFI